MPQKKTPKAPKATKAFVSKTKSPAIKYEDPKSQHEKGLKDYGKSRIPRPVPPMEEIFQAQAQAKATKGKSKK